MPKKFKGENTKAVASRERKEKAKKEAQDAEQKRLEDELWKEDDRLMLKKQKRNEEKEAKKREKIQRKLEAKELEEDETPQIPQEPKVEKEIPKKASKQKKIDHKIEENNILFNDDLVINNRSLNWDEEDPQDHKTKNNKKDVFVDRHPERRMKAAFREYEEIRLPELRKELPNVRYAQHVKMMRQEFERSDMNPMNKPHMAYNTPDETKVLEKKMKKMSLEIDQDQE